MTNPLYKLGKLSKADLVKLLKKPSCVVYTTSFYTFTIVKHTVTKEGDRYKLNSAQIGLNKKTELWFSHEMLFNEFFGIGPAFGNYWAVHAYKMKYEKEEMANV